MSRARQDGFRLSGLKVIDDLASPLVGFLVVVEGSIGLDDTVTELTEADDELAAVAVVAHSIIIG